MKIGGKHYAIRSEMAIPGQVFSGKSWKVTGIKF